MDVGLKDLKRHGQGKLRFNSSVVYEGSFVDNSIEGYGTILYANGIRYEGEWLNYQPHGRGTSRINGVLNSGIWVHGCLSRENSDRGLQATLIASLADCGFQ